MTPAQEIDAAALVAWRALLLYFLRVALAQRTPSEVACPVDG